MADLQELLSNNIDEDAKLSNVKYFKETRKIELQIEAASIVPYQKIENLKKDIVTNLDFVKKISVNPDYSSLGFGQSYENFLKYISDKYAKHMPSIKPFFENSDVKYDDNDKVIVIDSCDEFIINNILDKSVDRAIMNEINRAFGEKIKVNISFCEDKYIMQSQTFEEQKNIEIKSFADNVAQNMMNAVKSENKTQNDNKKGEYTPRKSKESFIHGDPLVVYKRKIKSPMMKIIDIKDEESIVAFSGEVFDIEQRTLNSGKVLVTLSVSDKTNSIMCKMFLKDKEVSDLEDLIFKGKNYVFEGRVRYDTFVKELVIFPLAINIGKEKSKRKDNAEVKRVELHCHTNMSQMDAVTPVKKIVKTANDWGHKAIAITDHGVLQSFPDAMRAKGDDMKIIYGLEGYLINDDSEAIANADDRDFKSTFIVFDIETTGLSAKNDMITEIGAVKIVNGNVVDEFSQLINPEMPIPDKIVELTGITDNMVSDMPTIEEVLPKFLDFVGEGAVVAHNAKFDVGFIKNKSKKLGLDFDPIVVDTLILSRILLKKIKRHRLNMVAKHLKISLENHHRAVDDAVATAKIFLKFMQMLKDRDINTLKDVNILSATELDYKNMDTYHVIILTKTQEGLKNLYKMVTHSHINTFYRRPRIPKSLLTAMREGLIIGSACEAGEVYKAVMEHKSEEDLEKIISYYDYLEIQPTGNNQFMIEKGLVKDEKELEDINMRIYELGKKYNKPTVATCDVHFLDPEDEVYRKILMASQGFGDAMNQPPLYLRTTEEMLKEFQYMGEEKAYEVVVENTNLIADSIDDILPVPNGTFPPEIEGSDDELRDMCYKKARDIYGDDLPQIVEARLERELNSIISNGYAVMYIIAQKLVTKSIEDGYLVGSRGSVGSSFAATMSDITEVNPLAPHYVCPDCKHSEFFTDGSYGSGADLPDKKCIKCGAQYIKDGHAIPFEVFLGFEGDKEPDIDLNFAGVYQACAHKYTEELFGEGKTFKAGTIGTVAEKTAFGFVKKYFEEIEQNPNTKEIVRLSMGCTGVKRTTGQHPGGIMVVPHYKDIHDFCPVQYPANDPSSGVKTTHFDYHSISGRILKLDILGHDVPTIIRLLEEITGMDPTKIPLDDKETIEIFTSTKSLKIVDEEYKLDIGSLGIPEFGTKFVRQMLKDTQPSTFAELVRISGLSHGTDVWLNNAQDLVRAGTAELKDVISTRDDIMNYLILQDLPPKEAFTIMERVRKGKGLTDENLALMQEKKVPKWYIDSCNKIKYMFPKAHAVAYVMMSFRIAYCKVHHPLAFYSTFFSIKVDDFDAELVCRGKNYIRSKMKEMEDSVVPLSKKEQDLYTILEVVDEMYSRGFEFHKVNLYESDSDNFIIKDGKLLPPLRALQGVGENAARNLVDVRDDEEFLSKEDIQKRAKVTKTVIEALDTHGCLKGLPDSNQLSLFQFA